MSRNALVIGGLGLIVAGLFVGLWLLLMKSDDSAAQPAPPTETAVTSGSSHGGTTTTPGLATPTPTVPAPGSGDNPREYQIGGTRVRDHRTGDHKPLDIPPNVHKPGGFTIQSSTTNLVSQKLLDVMKKCVAPMPREARGDKPRLEGQVVVAIKDTKVTVTQAVVQLRNVADDAAAPVKQCMEQQSVGVQVTADEQDVENYSINISFALP